MTAPLVLVKPPPPIVPGDDVVEDLHRGSRAPKRLDREDQSAFEA
jgi:hypothetical protein